MVFCAFAQTGFLSAGHKAEISTKLLLFFKYHKQITEKFILYGVINIFYYLCLQNYKNK